MELFFGKASPLCDLCLVLSHGCPRLLAYSWPAVGLLLACDGAPLQEEALDRMKAFRPPTLQKAYRALLSFNQIDIVQVWNDFMMS